MVEVKIKVGQLWKNNEFLKPVSVEFVNYPIGLVITKVQAFEGGKVRTALRGFSIKRFLKEFELAGKAPVTIDIKANYSVDTLSCPHCKGVGWSYDKQEICCNCNGFGLNSEVEQQDKDGESFPVTGNPATEENAGVKFNDMIRQTYPTGLELASCFTVAGFTIGYIRLPEPSTPQADTVDPTAYCTKFCIQTNNTNDIVSTTEDIQHWNIYIDNRKAFTSRQECENERLRAESRKKVGEMPKEEADEKMLITELRMKSRVAAGTRPKTHDKYYFVFDHGYQATLWRNSHVDIALYHAGLTRNTEDEVIALLKDEKTMDAYFKEME